MKPIVFSFIILTSLLTGCTSVPRGFPPAHGIQNFDKACDGLYRGSQPTVTGFEELQKLGVKSVVNLRADPVPYELPTVTALNMRYVHIPMSGVLIPTRQEIDYVMTQLEILPKPIYVHCQFGCDRTGLVVECWKIREGKLGNTDALVEAKAYGMSKWLPNFHSFIKKYEP